MNTQPHVIVVVGPTASGKSDFAVELAQKYNGEIISADSRQIYKGLDIGTGKITQEEMCGVPHYMLDICNLDETFSVAEYKRRALPILEDILARNKTPIICGGTGQYTDSLICTQEIPEVKPNYTLRSELEEKDVTDLYQELLTKDNRRAEGIDKHNKVRIIRALEIIDALGKVPEQSNATYLHPTEIYVMDISRELLRNRITKRLHKRLEAGMIDEVKNTIDCLHVSEQITSQMMRKFGLEYVTITKYLEGILAEDEMREEIITKSMQYAKRQQTWNKKYLQDAILVKVEK